MSWPINIICRLWDVNHLKKSRCNFSSVFLTTIFRVLLWLVCYYYYFHSLHLFCFLGWILDNLTIVYIYNMRLRYWFPSLVSHVLSKPHNNTETQIDAIQIFDLMEHFTNNEMRLLSHQNTLIFEFQKQMKEKPIFRDAMAFSSLLKYV